MTDKNIRLIDDNIFSSLHNTQGAAYDSKAKLYEKLVSLKTYNKIIWGTLPKDYIDFAEQAILNAKGKSIDIGCGGLIQTAGIYVNTKQNFILLDHSVEMLKIARQRLINLYGKVPENIILLQANAFQLPFEDEHFDSLVSFGMIHCFENKTAFINEALRVLKSGSYFPKAVKLVAFWKDDMRMVWNQLNARLLKWVKWEKGLYKKVSVRYLKTKYKERSNLFAHWLLVYP